MFTTKVHIRAKCQYTHFSSFEPFFRKTAWVKSLFHRASTLCSTSQLFENQIRKLKMFMSWNGFPRAVRNLLISKLNNKFSTNQSRTNFFDENDTRPKVWVRVPYLGKRGETLEKNRLKKIQRCLTVPVVFRQTIVFIFVILHQPRLNFVEYMAKLVCNFYWFDTLE